MTIKAYFGADPQRSLSLFIKGLALFVAGLIFIAVGYYQHHLWQIPGLVLLGLGCLCSIVGYVGLFIARMKQAASHSGQKR